MLPTPAQESPAPLRIVADDREAASGVVEALRLLPAVEVVVDHLTTGDYVVDGRCVFERKSMRDFAASILDQRLFQQARRLALLATPVAIILEGRARDLEGLELRREALQGALISLSLVFGLPVLRALDAEETARLLVYAGGQLRRCGEAALPWKHRKPRGKRRRQLHILQSLPGVGLKRATDLLTAFGSVNAVVNADPQALQSRGGLGPKTAHAIYAALRDEPAPPRIQGEDWEI